MDILGIGIQEILFILIIVLIIFGPQDIVKAGRATGRFLRKLITSPTWQTVQKTSRDLRNLPNRLIREAGIDEIKDDLHQIQGYTKSTEQIEIIQREIDGELKNLDQGLSAWTRPSPPSSQNPKQNSEES